MQTKEKELAIVVKEKEKEEVLSNSNIKADWLVASAVDDIYDLFD